MADAVTLRPHFGMGLTIAIGILATAGLATLIVYRPPHEILRYGWPILLVAYLTWIAFWAPSITIAPHLVTVRNPFREHEISWPAILRIDTKYALTLYTVAGRITAWSAPAPSRYAAARASAPEMRGLPESSYSAGSLGLGDLPGSESGLAGLYVRRRWEALREAGALDAGVEGRGVSSRWLLGRLTTVAVLMVATLAGVSF